jgi:PEP-CTERM motif
MKKYICGGMAAAFLLLFVSFASADVLYDNGPIDGTVDAFTINLGKTVSNSFSLSSNSTVTGVTFGSWDFPRDPISTIDWAITTDHLGGTTLFSGSGATVANSFMTTNSYGYHIYENNFSLSALLSAGTYWLQLSNAVTPNGNGVFWDENNGPSSAYSSGLGNLANYDINGTTGSESFQITGRAASVPEPTTMLLFGAGLAGLTAIRRKNRNG